MFFTDKPVVDFESAKTANTQMFGRYFHAMLSKGIYLGPSQFETLFVSAAIKDKHIDKILKAHKESLKGLVL